MKTPIKKIFGLFISLKTTVVCLFLLLMLVFFGTLYQVEFGLHAAQERYFYSYGLLLGGFIPSPGGALVLWILFLNLFASMMLHFQYGLRTIGLVLIHFGILLMLAGGWMTHLFGEESFLLLQEGEASNVSSGYKDWEISFWVNGESPSVRDVIAFDAEGLTQGDVLDLNELGLSLEVVDYHLNAKAFRDSSGTVETAYINHHQINVLQPQPRQKEPESHMPGVILKGRVADGAEVDVLLFGGDRLPAVIPTGEGKEVQAQLRRRRYPLPMLVELVDFEKEFHPESSIPAAFSSRIKVYLEDLEREALIEMNEPFRYQGYTFYQASYVNTKPGDPEISRFAVTRNYGRLIPYVSTGVTVVGLIAHFLIVLTPRRKKVKV